MRKLLIAGLLLGCVSVARSDSLNPNFGPLTLHLPFQNVNATYLYDLIGRQSLVGAETPLATIWKIDVTAGAVTSISGEGTPFVGFNLDIPNPAPQYTALAAIHPGVFGGRDFRTNDWMGGLKASINIF